MRNVKLGVVALVLTAAVLTGCSPRSSMSTLSVDSDSGAAAAFSLTKVLDLGTNYLVSLDYDNAILQYIEVIQHDSRNKEAYAGLYAAYAAQGKTEEANEIFQQAQEVFEDDADFLPTFLDDASLIWESNGGDGPFRMLSDHYWDDVNSIFAEDVGKAWLEADPQNADPYALLGAHYSSLEDENGLEGLLQNAQTNGVDLSEVKGKIEANSDGTITLTLQLEALAEENEAGENTAQEKPASSVKVKLDPTDNAQSTVQKVAEAVADSAASKVVEESGLTGEAADIANSMAQEALRKGLGGSGVTPSVLAETTDGTAASSAVSPQADDAVAEGFDWSEIKSELAALSGGPQS